MKETDYYKILNLNRNTTEEEIKRQYRLLALKFHPDRNPIDEEAEEKFKEINEAYAVLGDPEKRKAYDRFGYSGFRMRYNGEDNFHYSSGRSRNMGDRFFFGRGMGCRKGARFWRRCSSNFDEINNFTFDRNLIYGIEITSEEALYGTEKIIIARTRLGDKTYRFTIPAGIKNGATVKLGGGDHFSTDLYIKINVRE